MRVCWAAMSVVCALAQGCAGGSSDGDGWHPTDAVIETGELPNCLGTLWVPGEFDFETRRAVAVEVSVVNGDGSPRPGVRVTVHDVSAPEPGDQVRLGVGLTGADGRWRGNVSLPAGQSRVGITASILGVKDREVVEVTNGAAFVELGRDVP